MRILNQSALLLLSIPLIWSWGSWRLCAGALEDAEGARPVCFVTNVAQFRSVRAPDYLERCDFSLTGLITLVDTNRQLVVLQDATGAVALSFRFDGLILEPGLRVCLSGSNCCPYFPGFPNYPYCPSGRTVSQAFEAPMNWGEYHLTRMRGYLHPPVTGEYTFWVASDNSSELWLSPDNHPSRARKICFIPRFSWTAPREWSKFASQRSGPVLLKAGETYYIEALAEQTTIGENLAVAWQGPSVDQAVIGSSYLKPWGLSGTSTNGVLREYWTNFSAGDLTDLAGARPFESALAVERVGASVLGPGQFPRPEPIKPGEPWQPETEYRWVQVEGRVKFSAVDEGGAFLELSDGRAQVQVHVPHWTSELSQQIRNTPVRVEGVCEGVYDEKSVLEPGLIWATSTNCIAFIGTGTNLSTEAMERPSLESLTKTNAAMQGFYGTRGVVTFNDRVFGKDYLFVQEDTLAVLVSLEGVHLKNHLKAGQWVDLGGALQPSESVPVLRPLVLTELGWHSMPTPIVQPLGFPVQANREGRWNELEGVVHTVNTNGTISLVGKDGLVYLWLGQTPSNCVPGYVDAKLRVRGVLLLAGLDAPVLLVPSQAFVEIKEPAPSAPFGIPRRPIASLHPEIMESSWSHRAQIAGELTYRDTQSFFIQDNSGGIRVRCAAPPGVQVGETIEVLGFPTINGVVRTLAEPVVRPASGIDRVRPKELDVSDAMSSKQSGNLVALTATLLGRKNNGPVQMLELQEQQRVFSAMLSADQGTLPEIAAGSRLRVTGVCDNETTGGHLAGDKPTRAQFLASLNILLRSPLDVTVLSGPPWWTWRRTATLVGALLMVLLVTLLWVHLLRRRLERQQAAQLAFSRQVLERLEDERRRIAVNLHDSLGQILVAIKQHALLAIQRPADGQGLRVRLDEISGATSQAIEEVRQITHGLRPYQLDRLGLAQAIRASVSRASVNSSILFASRVEDIDGLFDKDAEIHVYRIVQEAVTNVVKHSAATEAAVVIKKKPGVVSLSIRDNGKGFDPAKPSSQPHDLGYGLNGIAERVRILGGTLTIDSRPGQGSSVSVEVPLSVLQA